MSYRRNFFAALAAACLEASVSAQDAPKTEKPDAPKEFTALKYRNIGPAAGGRVSRATGVPGNPLLYYAATASGGVWMSSDGGTTWKSVWDEQPISSIGSIAVAPSAATSSTSIGEANIRGNVARQRHLQSIDGGKTGRTLEAGRTIGTRSCIRRTPTSRSRRGSAMRSAAIPSAASTARATAASRGNRS